MKNPTSTSHVSSLFLLLLFKILFLGMAQNKTIPVNVGVVLDFDSLFGKIGLSCINMALSEFYASHADYKTRLVLHTRDSMRDVVVEAAAALDLIKNDEVKSIIIGPESAMHANFVIDLGDKAQVPVISFSTTSPSPTSFKMSSYLLRVAQNDSSQVEAISSIIKAFEWSEAVLIYAENEFRDGVIPHLANSLLKVNARILYWSLFPPMATDDQIVTKLKELMTMQTCVFIVHMLPSVGNRIFAKAKEIGMMSEGYAWIVTDASINLLGSMNSSAMENMEGVLGLRTYIPKTQELEKFKVRWQEKIQKDNPTLLNVKLDAFGLWAYDAAWALALATEKVNTTNFKFQKLNNISVSNSSDIIEILGVSQSGPELAQALASTTFRGLSGNFSLVNGQLKSSNFQIVNVIGSGVRGLGYWTPQNGLTRTLNSTSINSLSSSMNSSALGPVIWPGDTIVIPKGWIPTPGKRLKIVLPINNQFKEFVYWRTNSSTASGYCIDVFEAIMEELPYPVFYEFIPFYGSYNDLIDQVFYGKFEAAVGDITVLGNRSLYVDFTLPYTEKGVSMVVPVNNSKSGKNAWVFLKPLTWDLWVISGCFFMFIGFVVWVLEHQINDDFRGPPHQQISTSIWFSFSTMVFAHRERVVSNLARFVVIVWCFVVLVLTQSYTASLTSFLTVQQLQPTDVNLLIKNGDQVAIPKSNSVFGMLVQLGFNRGNLWNYTSMETLDQLFESGIVSAAFDETPYMKLFVSTYCTKYTTVASLNKQDGGFAVVSLLLAYFSLLSVFRKGMGLTLDASKVITNLEKQGKLRAIEDQWFKKPANCKVPESTSSSSSTLSLDSFGGLFLTAWISSSFALLLHAVIFLYEHRHIFRSSNPNASFWTKLGIVLRTYGKKNSNSFHSIGAVESSPSIMINCSPGRGVIQETQNHTLGIEMQETPSTANNADLNPQEHIQ